MTNENCITIKKRCYQQYIVWPAESLRGKNESETNENHTETIHVMESKSFQKYRRWCKPIIPCYRQAI